MISLCPRALVVDYCDFSREAIRGSSTGLVGLLVFSLRPRRSCRGKFGFLMGGSTRDFDDPISELGKTSKKKKSRGQKNKVRSDVSSSVPETCDTLLPFSFVLASFSFFLPFPVNACLDSWRFSRRTDSDNNKPVGTGVLRLRELAERVKVFFFSRSPLCSTRQWMS